METSEKKKILSAIFVKIAREKRISYFRSDYQIQIETALLKKLRFGYGVPKAFSKSSLHLTFLDPTGCISFFSSKLIVEVPSYEGIF